MVRRLGRPFLAMKITCIPHAGRSKTRMVLLHCPALRGNGPTALQFKPFKNLSKYLENEGGQRIEENKYI